MKQYLTFPELNNVSDFLEKMGMHSDFHKACSIVGIRDKEIIDQLYQQVAEFIPASKEVAVNKNIKNHEHIRWLERIRAFTLLNLLNYKT